MKLSCRSLQNGVNLGGGEEIILLTVILSALVPVCAPGKGAYSRNSHSKEREWLALSRQACLDLKDFGVCAVLNKEAEYSHHASSEGFIFSLQLQVSVTCVASRATCK